MHKAPSHFIIFDFSGTLSLAAVEFGRSENLVPALEQSGLTALGVPSEAFFWDEIVYPTWVEGSTTGRGYKAVLVERIAALGLHAPNDSDPYGSIENAVSDLLGRYFDQCRIDIRWRSLLEALRDDPSVQVVIATDHYAEATPLIRERLKDWGIDTVVLTEAVQREKNPFVIASSSDMGFHKADIRFWRLIHDKLCPRGHRVLLIDDFGGNEDSSDPYGNPARVTVRRRETEQVLREVFSGKVDIYSFIVDRSEINHFNGMSKEELYGIYIARAVVHVETFLKS
ncbi:MAG: hypothetical protein JW902_01600 [Syntrophaceae bacterium]|nr:hypothetical protein [Syntrophaceae bacterium]